MKHPCKCSHLQDAHIAGERCRHCHCDKFLDATTEHTAGLRQFAIEALAFAKDGLTRTGQVTPFFLLGETDGSLVPFVLAGDAGAIMENGHAKDALFGAVREVVRENQIEVVVFTSDCWIAKATEKGMALSRGDFRAKTRERAFQSALEEGLVTRSEAITVTVQTPLRVMIASQVYEREPDKRISFREVTVIEAGIDEFGGRQKMYGDLRPENLG